MSALWIHCNHCYHAPNPSDATTKKYYLSSCGHVFCEHCNVNNEVDLKCSVCKKGPFTSHCINRTLNRNLQNLFRPPLSLYESLFRKVKSVIAFQSLQVQIERKRLEEIAKQCQQLVKEQATLKEENERLKRKMSKIVASGDVLISLVQNLEENCSHIVYQVRDFVTWSDYSGSKTNFCNESRTGQHDCMDRGFGRQRCSVSNVYIGSSVSNDASTSTADQLLPNVVDTLRKDVSPKSTSGLLCESNTPLRKCSPSFSLLNTSDLVTPITTVTGTEGQGTSVTNVRKSNPYMTELWSRKNGSMRGVFKGRMSSPLSGATWPRLTLGVGHKDYPSGTVRSSKSVKKVGETRSLLDYTLKPLTSTKYPRNKSLHDK